MNTLHRKSVKFGVNTYKTLQFQSESWSTDFLDLQLVQLMTQQAVLLIITHPKKETTVHCHIFAEVNNA